MPKKVSKEIKEQVAKRAGFCCEYCRSQLKFSSDPFSIEHIIPKSKGGSDEIDNLAYSCLGCNFKKYTRTEGIDPATGDLVPLFNPRNSKWEDSFLWDKGSINVIGRTKSGRATIDHLGLNRENLVNLRRILMQLKLHPPK